ncbi:phosphate ABC transporter permease subunit PstC [Bartonella sp. DGB1]|uniref:phosphate ABC transporter permease subunit PstC n=1 Tax=Bartonella sp. DGB1 TaxID=3239807 RepID=UPI003524FA2C
MTSSTYFFGSIIVVVLIAILSFFLAYYKMSAVQLKGEKLHSRPHYYGVWVFLLVILSCFAFLFVYYGVVNYFITHKNIEDLHNVLNRSLSVKELNFLDDLNRVFTKIPSGELDVIVKNSSNLVNYMAQHAINLTDTEFALIFSIVKDNFLTKVSLYKLGFYLSCCFALVMSTWGILTLKAQQRSRNAVESIVVRSLMLASLTSVLVTIGIILSMLFQSINFFKFVSISDFLFGTTWDPRFAASGSGEVGQFGLLPLLAGTLYIALVAMLIAVPLGLFAAIYMAEYAPKRVRAVIKPLLEILAGIPTIVYGFFALSIVGPFLRDISIFLAGGQGFIMAQSVLTAGLVMGIMLIPYVSSLSDDVLNAVPRSLREGSLGLGATLSETIRKVLFPAALPGIISALLLTASRAIGETMIVTLAAGVAPNLSWNPFEAMTTITIKIVSQLTGDTEFMSPQTLVAFALGLTLFILTLIMNIIALYISRRYQEKYE